MWAAAPGSRRILRRLLHACARLGVPVCMRNCYQGACCTVVGKSGGHWVRSPWGAEVLLAHCAQWYSMGLLHGFISLRAMPLVNYYQGASLHGGRDAERQWASGGEASESAGQMRRSMLVLDRMQAPPPPE